MTDATEEYLYDIHEIIQNYQDLQQITVIPQLICQNAHECECLQTSLENVGKCDDNDQGHNLMCVHTNLGRGDFDATEVVRDSLEILEQKRQLKAGIRERVEAFFTVRRTTDNVHALKLRPNEDREIHPVEYPKIAVHLRTMQQSDLAGDTYINAHRKIKGWIFGEALWVKKTVTNSVGRVLYDQLQSEGQFGQMTHC